MQSQVEALPIKVVKRDQTLENFEPQRIVHAIQNAGAATGEFDQHVAQSLSNRVLQILSLRFGAEGKPTVEQIQNLVEETLAKADYFQTAKSFIIYRSKHQQLRADRKTLVDVESSVNEYLDRSDWRVKANANQGYSLGGLILNVSGKMIANYWLSHIYSEEVGAAHRNGDIHIHDLDMLAGYCAGWSLKTLLMEGFNGVPGKTEANPPKHLSSVVGQIVNFLGTLQNEWAGAQAFSSFDTYVAPYVRVDNLNYTEVKQAIQELIYNLNVPSRWGTQTPFTNLTFDWVCPEDLKNEYPILGGEIMEFTYGELEKEMSMINRAYMEVMMEGDAKGRVFTFPIPTYNITPEFAWEHENTELLFQMTSKYGLPYFQNFLNSELKPNMIRSMCCRLQLDLRELLKRGNGLFGSAEQTGSLGVVTINCARLGYLYQGNKEALYQGLDRLLFLAKSSLEVKRKVIQDLMDQGLFPYTKRYLGTLRNHFSTIGVNGINEMIRNFSKDEFDLTSSLGQAMAEEFLDYIRDKMSTFQEETNHLYNLEATPAEGTTYRFAKEDKKQFPKILQAGNPERPYYTNSSQLPVGFTEDPFLTLDLQTKLQQKYTGGTVLHLYMNESLPNPEICMNLVKKVLTNYRLPYITISPTFSICPTHGYINGEHQFCPKCDAELIAQKEKEACAC
jgi:anaerobic ribonucleoside-triphosphate reductase